MTYKEGKSYRITLKSTGQLLKIVVVPHNMCEKEFNRMLMFKYQIYHNDVKSTLVK